MKVLCAHNEVPAVLPDSNCCGATQMTPGSRPSARQPGRWVRAAAARSLAAIGSNDTAIPPGRRDGHALVIHRGRGGLTKDHVSRLEHLFRSAGSNRFLELGPYFALVSPDSSTVLAHLLAASPRVSCSHEHFHKWLPISMLPHLASHAPTNTFTNGHLQAALAISITIQLKAINNG